MDSRFMVVGAYACHALDPFVLRFSIRPIPFAAIRQRSFETRSVLAHSPA